MRGHRRPVGLPVGAAFIVVLGALLGCSSGPSEKDIESAVRSSLQQRVPITLARNLLGGERAVVETVRVIKVGKPQGSDESRYWPIRVYAKGVCTVTFGGQQPFEGETEFNLTKNPYGEWVASPGGLGF